MHMKSHASVYVTLFKSTTTLSKVHVWLYTFTVLNKNGKGTYDSAKQS